MVGLEVAQDRGQWKALMSSVINFRVSIKRRALSE
jgi:hypothetical protein